MALIGLVRITDDPVGNLRQHTALSLVCDRVLEEKASRRLHIQNRPELLAALNGLDSGDALVVEKVGMLGQGVSDGLVVLADLYKQGVSVRVLKGVAADDADISDHVVELGRGIDAIRRSTLTRRIKEGQNEARMRGVRIGRPRAVDDAKHAEILERRDRGESLRVIAHTVGVSIGTVSNVLTSTPPTDRGHERAAEY